MDNITVQKNSKEVFKQLILDFHKIRLPDISKRDIELPALPISLRKAFVFLGMRRSGKTWYLYQIMQDLIEEGLKFENIVYINFEDDRLVGITVADLNNLLEAYFELYPDKINDPNIHFFLDEIHEIIDWDKFIRRILDTEKMRIYLTGSSAKMLSKEIATSLRGRALEREVFPFGFREYLRKLGMNELGVNPNLSSKERAIQAHYLNKFLYYGGFPETIGTSDDLHRELLQGYIDIVIYRDIVERYKVTNTTILRLFLRHCLQNATSTLSIHKIYQVFKSQNYSISKNSLYEFMGYFEDAYCLFSVPLYHFSQKKSEQSGKKIYPVDQGLITAFTIKQQFEQGSRFETAVFCALRRKYKDIFYFQTSKGNEVDFLTLSPESAMNLYQASISLADLKTNEREIKALRQAMEELQVKEGTIITLEEKNVLEVPEGLIRVIPLFQFLLDTDLPSFSSGIESNDTAPL